MFEQKHQELVPVVVFVRRMITYVLLVIFVILGSLSIGVVGYHYLAGLPWVDSFLNASMILGGMGEIDPLTNTSAKIFASVYALFSGLVFIAIMGILFAPIMHRVLHSFHMEDKDLKK
ncbi:MAG: hypothetical protein A2787_05090 [Omnitrophica WOR_2 bacterium RIFCSPHIGHO2_01_FULL_48_9]|nr:MAG: hypothetical protein A3D10_01635 [Omnitrophica WOR_2 bacterium RIFCSPHIGHO2_02_FULL_48_11]OGX33990.1 MAG: hypothetical protein A2787_05090 [Omnitrophica WOR_2 bacterium RIFCSPHIGHO2_01_FULL_48_9]